MDIPHLDYYNIEKSLQALQNSEADRFKSYLLPDEYNVPLKPEQIMYAMSHTIFEFPEVPELFNMQRTEPRTAFVYDNPHLQILAENLPDALEWEALEVGADEDSFKALSRYTKIINACTDHRWASLTYLICAQESIETLFWDCRFLSPFRFPLMGVSIPKYNPDESLEERFRRATTEQAVVPKLITPSQAFLEFYWNELYTQPYANFVEAFFVSFLQKYKNLSFATEIEPFKENLFQAFITLTQASGAEIAVRLFHPHWFALFNNTQRSQIKELAEFCVKLLRFDEINNNLYDRHYNLKAYWSLYYQDPSVILEMKDSLTDNKATFCAETALVLWCMGHNEQAKTLLLNTDLSNINDPNIIHKGAVAALMLECWDIAQNLFNKLAPDYLTNDTYKEKLFWQALAHIKLNEPDQAEAYLEKSKKADPLFPEKEHLKHLVTPCNETNSAITI